MKDLILDYTVTDVVRDENNITVLRVSRDNLGKASLKIVKKTEATSQQIQNLNREFNIEKNIGSNHAIHALELVSTIDLFGFSMEELPAMNLKRYLKIPSTDLESRLAIAIDLSLGVGEIHLAGIAHRNLNLKSIYIEPEQQKIKISDFDVATEFPSEEDYLQDLHALGTLLLSLFEEFELPLSLSKALKKIKNEEYHSAFCICGDLKKILEAYRTNLRQGHIPLSPAVYDHFHFPSQLYGRQKELYAIYQWCSDVWNGERLFLLLTGTVGIGKSSLAEAAGKSVSLRQGRYIEVIFDPIQKNIPYKAFSKALTQLFEQIASDSEDKVRETRKRTLMAVGENAQVIADIVPAIENLIPKQAPAVPLTGEENHNRLRFLLVQLFKSMIEAERPLVMFLDNLEYADESSLGLIKDLLDDTQIQYLFLIGAYSNRPTSATFKEIISKKEHFVSLHLEPLSCDSIFEMVLDITPMGSLEQSQKLSNDIFDKSAGNPYYALELLKLICEERLLAFDTENLVWKGDLKQIGEFIQAVDLEEIHAHRFSKLNPNYLKLLKFTSELETPPEKNLLCEMTEQPLEEVERGLSTLTQYGLMNHKRILRKSEIPLFRDDERDQVHLQIARTLHKKGAQSLESAFYYKDLPNELFQKSEVVPIASLFLKAGIDAKNRGAYPLAIHYFSKGISLLPQDCWDTHPKLTAGLKQQLGTTLVVNGNYQSAEKVLEECIEHSTEAEEKRRIYREMIFLYGNLKEFDQLFATAKKALACYNFPLEVNTGRLCVLKSYLLLQYKMAFRSWDELTELDEIKDRTIFDILSLLSLIFYPSFLTNNSNLFLKTAIDMINLTIDHGSSYFAPIPLATYAMVLGSTLFNDFENSAACGAAALKLTKRYPKKGEIGGAVCTYYSFIHRWKHPLRESIPALQGNLRFSLETGGGFVGTTNATYLNLISLLVGTPLDEVQKNIQYSINELKKYSTQGDEQLLFVHREVCRALRGLTPDSTDPFPPEFSNSNGALNPLSKMRYKMWRTILLTLFNNWKEGVKIGDEVLLDQNQFPNWPEWNPFYFYYGLALASSIDPVHPDQALWKKLLQTEKKLKRWGAASPQNYAHHAHLISAEIERLKNNPTRARLHYEKGVKSALDNQFIHEAAVCLEYLGRFCIAQNQKEQASIHFTQAFQLFSKWGAEAKKREFRLTYSNYLEELPLVEKNFGEGRLTVTGTFPNDFDINALLERSIALTQEIQLQNLAESILILGEISGSERGHLILNREKNALLIASKVKGEPLDFHRDPVSIEANQHLLPLGAVKTVLRSKSIYKATDPHLEENFQQDPYVLSHQPKNIIALPFIHKGQLSGILYLENSRDENPFTKDKISTLSLLAPQIAIALANAQYYEQIENRVKERTVELSLRNKELSQALQNVEKVHAQQLEQEKLASLGLLSSGIAHELKNPLNFIINFSEVAAEQLKELEEGLLDDNTFLENLLSLQESVAKINSHSLRADAILKRMLEHAHTDINLIEIDLNMLLEQAIDLSLSAYQKKSPKFKVKLIKELAPIPKFAAQPNDLMRVFINLFDNAFYAMDQKFRLNTSFEPILSITSQPKEGKAFIQIIDNGVGISKELIKKTFQPFFTTKPAGSGTGLGLSISYDIIVKEHQGTIQVESCTGESTTFSIALPLQREGP